jgi:Na+/H+-dicarboxylate symporter
VQSVAKDYTVVYVVMSLILSLWLIPGLIAALTPLRFGAILRAFRGPLVTAFATGNVLIVLPILAAESKALLAQSAGVHAEPTEREESSVDILVPAAFPFPSLGTMLALMFVLFGGWYVGSTVPVTQYATLTVAGIASLFGGTVLALPFLFNLLRLPSDLFQVFVTGDVIASRFGTLLAAMHIIAIA